MSAPSDSPLPNPNRPKRTWRGAWGMLRDLLVSGGPLVLLVVALVALAFWWLNPNPPKKVVLATGPAHSAYAAFGERYAAALAAEGIELQLQATDGSRENLALLRAGGVDMAFVQGGSAPMTEDDHADLVSLGSLFVEPLWLFYRERTALAQTGLRQLTHVSQLKGGRLNAGTPGSGVPALFSSVLEPNRLSAKDFSWSEWDQTPATVAFLNGRLDALVFASAPESPLVQMLLLTPGVRLMDFAQSEAYARRFPYLKAVVLPQGVADLAANLPPKPVRLLAPTSGLLARADTHPAVLQLMAQTAVALHREPGWFGQAREFPNLAQTELPLAPEATRAMAGAAPFLQRHLPFWMANLVERMWLALGLILALVLPLSRVIPPIYTLRIRSRVFRWYAELRDIEDRAAAPGARVADAPERVGLLLTELDLLEAKAGRMQVPLAYADELYALRSHIQLVRKKLTLLQ